MEQTSDNKVRKHKISNYGKTTSMLIEISNTQGDLFEYISKNGYDYRKFVDDYMKSSLCEKDMDAEYSYLQLMTPLELMDFIEKDIVLKIDPFQTKINDSVMFLIGFLYRFVSRKHNIPSRKLYEKCGFDFMEQLIVSHYYDYVDADYKADVLHHYRL